MHFHQEFKAHDLVTRLKHKISLLRSEPVRLMEVCGGQTHAILKYGLDQLLAPHVDFIHGPGCPVCVTAEATIDLAIMLAQELDVTICTFGDMMRVPGSSSSLATAKALGASIKVIQCATESVNLAALYPERQVVMFAIGFETTAPTYAVAVKQAAALALSNWSMLGALKLVPPVLRWLLAPDTSDGPTAHSDRPSHYRGVDCQGLGLLAAGHVCAVVGTEDYVALAQQLHIPIAITGFEPVDILRGVLQTCQQLLDKQYSVSNQYERIVAPQGNVVARTLINEVFEVDATNWRDFGVIPGSGLRLRQPYRRFDAESRFATPAQLPRRDADVGRCLARDVLSGAIKPTQCPRFGNECRPEHPLGAPMASCEGACATYLRYQGVTPYEH